MILINDRLCSESDDHNIGGYYNIRRSSLLGSLREKKRPKRTSVNVMSLIIAMVGILLNKTLKNSKIIKHIYCMFFLITWQYTL